MHRYGYKSHSDSYLMSLKKKDIIAELRAAEHNFFVTDEALDNAVEAGKKYGKEAVKTGKEYGAKALEVGKSAIESTYKFFQDLKSK